MQQLCDHSLDDGRHRNVDVIRTTHQLRNWSATRSALRECDILVFFLHKGTWVPDALILRLLWFRVHARFDSSLTSPVSFDAGTPRPIRGYFKEYMALGADTIARIIGDDQKKVRPMDSRWVAVYVHVPYFVCGERKLELL